MRHFLPLAAVLIVSAVVTYAVVKARSDGDRPSGTPSMQEAAGPERSVSPSGPAPAGMVWIPGGQFTMGTADTDSWPAERPAHPVSVDGFWMDATEVTNAQFEKFVDATGYVTTAETKPDWEEIKKQTAPGTPKPPDEQLVAGAVVFTPPDHPVDLNDFGQWWRWTPGANWRHPEGPESNLQGREDHPVVHVSWDDAMAYCKWAGKRLPTEAEWECAARGGLEGKRYAWGNEPVSETTPQCNIWQGHFPDKLAQVDKFPRTAPVKSFPPNGYGLYDVAGNVWEWCSDWYRPDTYRRQLEETRGGVVINPQGPTDSFDPRDPYAPKRSHRGGSFLCNDAYCSNYRPSGRHGNSPDTGMSHVGFRCVKSP